MSTLTRLAAFTVTFIFLSLLAACGLSRPEVWMHTPIPKETLYAYDGTKPIFNEKEAVLATHSLLLTSRSKPISTPRLIFVEYITTREAAKRLQLSQSKDLSNWQDSEGNVWLVILEGTWE